MMSRAKRLRAFLIQRDGSKCHWCSRKLQIAKYLGKNGRLAHDFATIDHLIRVKDGGKLNRKNTVLACKKCNSSRHHGNMNIQQFLTDHPDTGLIFDKEKGFLIMNHIGCGEFEFYGIDKDHSPEVVIDAYLEKDHGWMWVGGT